jgi:multicomponent Na+:H+ antiporter subunit E
MSTMGYGALLVAAWVLLWGAVSWANVLSGIVVAAVLVVVLVPRDRRRVGWKLPPARPLDLGRLGVYLARQLVVSNWLLIREVLAPRSKIRTGVIAVPVTGCSDQLLTILANFMAMAPGTMPVELADDRALMYVHVLHLGDVEETRRQLWRLRDLTVRALGSDHAIACLTERP